MLLYTCPQCEQGNHVNCRLTTRAIPPGSFGGAKCMCLCNGRADYGKLTPMEGIDNLTLTRPLQLVDGLKQLVLEIRETGQPRGFCFPDNRS